MSDIDEDFEISPPGRTLDELIEDFELALHRLERAERAVDKVESPRQAAARTVALEKARVSSRRALADLLSEYGDCTWTMRRDDDGMWRILLEPRNV